MKTILELIQDYTVANRKFNYYNSLKDSLTYRIGEQLAQPGNGTNLPNNGNGLDYGHALKVYKKANEEPVVPLYQIATDVNGKDIAVLDFNLPKGPNNSYQEQIIAKFPTEDLAYSYQFHLIEKSFEFAKKKYIAAELAVRLYHMPTLEILKEYAQLEYVHTDDYSLVDSLAFELNHRVRQMEKDDRALFFSQIEADDFLSKSFWYKMQLESYPGYDTMGKVSSYLKAEHKQPRFYTVNNTHMGGYDIYDREKKFAGDDQHSDTFIATVYDRDDAKAYIDFLYQTKKERGQE